MKTNFILILTLAVAGIIALALPFGSTHGTRLSLSVSLAAWDLIAGLTTHGYADSHRTAVLLVTCILSTILYLIPALAIWFTLRKRMPKICSFTLVVWCLWYGLCLFVVFPTADLP